jgi:hypothetical protein
MQVIRTFATESAIYRVSKDIDNLAERYKSENCDKGRASIDAISHYAVEAALLKVYGSEMLDAVLWMRLFRSMEGWDILLRWMLKSIPRLQDQPYFRGNQ